MSFSLGKNRSRLKLLAKLRQAQLQAQPVAKSGHNGDQTFSFSRFEDVLAEAKRLLHEQRIVYTSELVDVDLTFGKSGVIAKVEIEYEVTDLDTGYSMFITWVGTGYDSPGDKAIFKAQTGTEKYFLARLLQIPWGEDPEGAAGSTAAFNPETEQGLEVQQPWVLNLGGVRDRLKRAGEEHDLDSLRLLLGACGITAELPQERGQIEGWELRLTEGERTVLLAELARIEQDAIGTQPDEVLADG